MSFSTLRISATHLTLLALAMWCCSLASTGLVTGSDAQGILGINILFSGWLGALVLNFAWFANVFFIYSVGRLMSGKAPVIPAVLAPIIALDTFRLDTFPTDEGGGHTYVYGYGWGVIIWLLSMCVLVAATGLRLRERNAATLNLLSPISCIFVAIVVGVTWSLASKDRLIANQTELQRIEKIAFKRGRVCDVDEPFVIEPIRKLSGPLEIALSGNAQRDIYPFTKIDYLLEWGVPSVRASGRDFSVDLSTKSGLIYSDPAFGTPAGKLVIREDGDASINVKLLETVSDRAVFDYTWRRVRNYVYCPDYYSYPTADQQPKKLLLQALSIDTKKNQVNKVERYDRSHFPASVAHIVSQSDGVNSEALNVLRKLKPQTNEIPIKARRALLNIGCPADIGFGVDETESDNRIRFGDAFALHGRRYYMPDNVLRLYCGSGYAFIYRSAVKPGSYFLHIEKRELKNFKQEWVKSFVIPLTGKRIREDDFLIDSIVENDGSIEMALLSKSSEKMIHVKVSAKRL